MSNKSAMRVASNIPRLYLGTMTFGWSQTSSKVDENVALEMVRSFAKHLGDGAAVPIDTARIYSGGATESILGSVLDQLKEDNIDFRVGTKAHPSQPNGLSPEGVRAQLRASLDATGLSDVDEFYLHQPDVETPLAESLAFAHDLATKEGLCRSIGMSNYHHSEVARAMELCDRNGWTKPSVYQGLYNPLNRWIEEDLLPVLREHDCSFVAYNPLAAGLLTGKHSRSSNDDDDDDKEAVAEVPKGRFRDNPNYLPRFYTDANFRALDVIRTACEKESVDLLDATFLWMLRHSALRSEASDGLLLGASSTEQLEANLAACAKAASGETLPTSVLDAFDEAWAVVKKAGPFPYWRSYSADMPDRESLDPGASYDAKKK